MFRSLRARRGGHKGPAPEDVDRLLVALGRSDGMLVRERDPRDLQNLHEVEFRIYSQFGEDGIIAYLTGVVPIERTVFVEIGVQDYTECNTRLLLCTDNWQGLIIDDGTAHLDTIERTGMRWRHHVDAVSAWITRENVNDVIRSGGVQGDIGLLSLDVDGNDYWILEAIDAVDPRIVVAEYNSTFGAEATISIPYQADFARATAHHSHLYYGASLAALYHLMKGRGYRLVGSNRAGNNAFFVRDDVAGDLPDLVPTAAYVAARFREARDANGNLTYLGGLESIDLIADLPVVDVVTGATSPIRDAIVGSP